MGSILTKSLLFLSSYFPLTVVFFFLFFKHNLYVSIFILSIGMLGLIGMLIYFSLASKVFGPVQIRASELQRRDGEAMSYIVSYVIPFVALPFSGWEQGVALSIFFFILGVLYVNSNMIHINPMLNLIGYHLYEITLEDGSLYSLITRRRIKRGEELRVIQAGDDIFLEKRK